MVFKLQLFGLPGGSFLAMKIVGWIYTLIAVAGTVALARRTVSRDGRPIIWLAILILASLRSPFLPPYGVFPALWLLTLLAATVAPTAKRLCVVLLAWVMLNAFIPQLHPDVRLISIVVLLPQILILILIAFAFRKSFESSGTEVLARCSCQLADHTV
jgi:low temperature requirement protein LtrA